MNRLQFRRWGVLLLTTGCLGSLGGIVSAQAPVPVSQPLPAPQTTVGAVEVYYGTTKVAPIPVPAPLPQPVEVAPPKEEPAPKPRVESPIYIPIIPAPQWSRMPIPAHSDSGVTQTHATFITESDHSLITYASAVLGRLFPPAPSRTAETAAPQVLIVREDSKAAATPNVVVVREPSPEIQPAVAQVSGFHLSPEMMIVGGVSLACLLMSMFVVGRSLRPAMMPLAVAAPTAGVVPTTPAGPPHDPERDGPLLLGKYRAGPLPETAEPFDMGPTYHEELAVKKQQEEASAAAIVGLVMQQNLSLVRELNEEAEPLPLQAAEDEETVLTIPDEVR